MFHLFFQMYVASVFISMLQVFYLDIAYVCNGFQLFLQVFQIHVSNVSYAFFLYVASVASECF
jgi:hypothetical protein